MYLLKIWGFSYNLVEYIDKCCEIRKPMSDIEDSIKEKYGMTHTINDGYIRFLSKLKSNSCHNL